MANVCTPITTTEGGGTCTFDPVQAISRVFQVTTYANGWEVAANTTPISTIVNQP